jgi:hypothetical protein
VIKHKEGSIDKKGQNNARYAVIEYFQTHEEAHIENGEWFLEAKGGF